MKKFYLLGIVLMAFILCGCGNKEVDLNKTSTITLTGDTYVKSLTNADTTNSNINLNGYKLYVGGIEFKK